MSERNYEAEAREIAELLCVEHHEVAPERAWALGGAIIEVKDPAWPALLRLARQPRGMATEVPEGHFRVQIALAYDNGIWLAWTDDQEAAYWHETAIVTADVPLPKPVDVVGSVKP